MGTPAKTRSPSLHSPSGRERARDVDHGDKREQETHGEWVMPSTTPPWGTRFTSFRDPEEKPQKGYGRVKPPVIRTRASGEAGEHPTNE